MTQRVLFISSTRLGDAVLSTAILESLKEAYPKAQITLVTSNYSKGIFEDDPQIEQVISIEKKRLSLHWFELWRQLRSMYFDCIFDLRGSALSYFLKAKQRLIWRKRTQAEEENPEHKIVSFYKFLKEQGFPEKDPKICISPQRITAAVEKFSLTTDDKILCVAPIATWYPKQWPKDNFRHLLKDLLQVGGPFAGAKVAFLCADNERPLLDDLAADFKECALEIPKNTPILDLAVLLTRSNFFIGNDSGLMHLAAACGTKTLGLFGPSPEKIYGPWGKNADYVRTPQSHLELWQIAKEHAAHDSNPPLEPYNLMQTLHVNSVRAKIDEMLE